MSRERCKHGLAAGTCSRCASPAAYRSPPRTYARSSAGGVSEVYRGFTMYYTPPPEREWSFRPEPGAKLQSCRSAFQARRAINELLDGTSESTPRRNSAMTSVPKTSSGGAYGSQWTDDGLRACVEAYARMMAAESRSTPLKKSDIVAALVERTGRTKGSIEMRLQNISAVLQDREADWLDGYKPLSHYPERLKSSIDAEYPELG